MANSNEKIVIMDISNNQINTLTASDRLGVEMLKGSEWYVMSAMFIGVDTLHTILHAVLH